MSDHGKAHAALGPSAAERWIACPASVQLVVSLGREDDPGGSVWADEGTRAHTRAYLEAAHAFGLIDDVDYEVAVSVWASKGEEQGDDLAEMTTHAEEWASLLQQVAAGLAGPRILLEQRVYPQVPGVWGTADAVLFDATTVVAADYKYGKGVRVQAAGNPQARLYALGALEAYGDVLGDTESVLVLIHQPRVVGGTTSEEMTAADLRLWREQVAIPAALETRAENPHYGPSEEACRWCPASGVCKVRMKHVTQRDFGHPGAMDAEDLAEAVLRLAEIRDWCNAVEAEGLKQAYSEGKRLPGLKVILTGGRRRITDDTKAIELLVAAGYPRDKIARPGKETTQTLSVLDRLVGKENLPEVLEGVFSKGDGKPALVIEDDPREQYTKADEAAKDFREDIPDDEEDVSR